MNLNASLLREKFVINDLSSDNGTKRLNIVARSNRLPLILSTGENKPEKIVVRAQSMHICVRLAAAIVNEFNKHGPILSRNPPLKWDLLWDDIVLSPYERQYSPETWCSIYSNGKVIFSYGTRESFLDVIEKCDALNNGNEYEKCIALTEDTFKKAGKPVKISYDSNMGMITAIEKQQARNGMVLRMLERSTTFNLYVKTEGRNIIDPSQILSVSAAFLEGVQLAYFVGFNLEKMRAGFIEAYSDEHRKIKSAQQRLIKLEAEISAFENQNIVRYRPERPIFSVIVNSTEKIAATMVLNDDGDGAYVE